MQNSTFEAGYSSGKLYYEAETTQNTVISTGLAVSYITRNNCEFNFSLIIEYNLNVLDLNYGYRIVNILSFDNLQTVNVNTWNHVALVYNGESIKAYFNRELVSSEVMIGSLSNNFILNIGGRCGRFYHTGLVDEVKEIIQITNTYACIMYTIQYQYFFHNTILLQLQMYARELSGHDIIRLSKQ